MRVMPRGSASKRGASTSRGGKPWRGRGGQRGARRNRDLLEDGRQESRLGTTSFSMADEARHTSQHSAHWDSIGSLRNKPVHFVSAGSIEPLKELEEDLSLQESGNKVDGLGQPQGSPSPQDYEEEQSLNTCKNENESGSADEVSVIGPEELEQDILQAAHPDRASDQGGSETAFFFDLTGNRHASSAPRAPIPIPSCSPEPGSSSSDEVILFRGRDATPMKRAPEPALTSEPTTITLTQMETEIRAVEEDLSISTTTPRGRGRSRNNNKVKPKGKRATRGQKQRRIHEDDEDDDAAIVADYLANMREHGEMQDLLDSGFPDVRNTRDLGGSDNEESYIAEPKTSPTQSKALEQQEQDTKRTSYDSGSELDDATLAKLLEGHVPGAEDHATLEAFVSSCSVTSESEDEPAFGQGSRQDVGIDDFDLMDWTRPSLRKKKKSKAARSQITFDISDDDLQQALQTAWNNDRQRKSERKKQREELRALGMLGKHATKPDDLRTKYPAGMDIQQVGEEIKGFLRGNAETLTMPPMDTHARKIVHEIANKFKIKSKSTGKAENRRTSLYRTKRTLQYSEASFDQAIARIHRRFLPRLDIKGKRGNKAPPQRTSHTAASYREGEVVGGAAPELGSENRGRAMLEKMGWSTGTALGAMDNKGILQPVPQTMKKSKAGLG